MRAAFSPPPKQPINSNAKTNGPPIEGPGSSSLSEAGPLDEESHAVSPSLLKPLDTSTALEAQRAGQIEDSASRAGISEYTSERSGFATDRSTPVPLTPDQVSKHSQPWSLYHAGHANLQDLIITLLVYSWHPCKAVHINNKLNMATS